MRLYSGNSGLLLGNKPQSAGLHTKEPGALEGTNMNKICRRFGTLLLAGVFALSLATMGCAEHRYRVYDPVDNSYHRWNHDDGVYYQQWIVVTHHAQRPYRDLDQNDQRNYWQWRHDHQNDHRDRDHDHDHDRH